jgi:hypothetical protein
VGCAPALVAAYVGNPAVGRRLDRQRFRFYPVPPTKDPGADRRFAAALLTALRAASGLGAEFAMEFRSGRGGSAWFECSAGPVSVWARGTLFPAYRPAGWGAGADGLTGSDEQPVLFGALERGPGVPLPTSDSRGPVADALLGGIGSIPEGVALRFEARAAPATRLRPPGNRPPEPPVSGPYERLMPATDFERRLRERTEERGHEPHWSVQVSILTRPGLPGGRASRMGTLARVSVRCEGGNGLRFRRPNRWFRRSPPRLDFSEPELAGLFPSPFAAVAVPWDGEPHLPRLLLGRSETGGLSGIPVPPREGRHLIVLGETGSGKSSALLRLAQGALRHGAVVLLDPIGDTARRFRALLPANLRSRLRFVSPIENPVGINALACAADRSPESLAGRGIPDLVEALRRVRLARFADTPFWGPRIEETLLRTLGAAAASPGATLTEAYHLLTPDEGDFRGWGEPGREAARSLRLWAESRTEEVEGTRRLLGEIARNPVLEKMLCDRSHRWDLGAVGSAGAISVISGDAPQAGESAARYLLGVYLALLWPVLLARSRSAKLFLLLDEVQLYGHAAIAEFLRLGRRANLHLFGATQSLSSLPRDLAEPFRTNSADFLLFRGDPEDAREFAHWNPALSAERLLAQPRGSAALLVGKGQELRWLRIRPPRVATEPENVPGEARPSRQSESPSGPRTAPAGLADTEREALRAASDTNAEGTVRISLDRLREQLPGGDLAVRLLGGRLRAQGLLRRSGRDANGRFWEVAELPRE